MRQPVRPRAVPAAAAPLFVQAAGSDTGATAAASLDVTLGAAATAGNLLVVAANSDAPLTISGGGGGWSLAQSAVGNQATYLWRKVATGGETSATVTPSVSDTVTAGMAEFSGVTSLDVAASDNRFSTPGATALTGTTAATAQAVELVVAVAGPHAFSSTSIPTSPLSWTNAQNVISRGTSHATSTINVALFVGYYVTSSTGTQSDTCTWTNGTNNAGGVIAAFV